MTTTSMPVICILGMHRSGSSLAAQILHGNGVRTGSSLIGRSRFNPEGHLEDRFVVCTNKKLLRRFGGTWDRPPELPERWLEEPEVRALLVRAERYRRSEVETRLPFFIKDPRLALVFPFWQQAFGSMRVLVVLRDPESVARSLLRRQQEWLRPGRFWWRIARYAFHRLQGPVEPLRSLTYDRAIELWHHYYDRIVKSLNGLAPSVMVQERILADPRGEIERILADLGLGEAHELEGIVKPELSHSPSVAEVPSAVLEVETRLLAARRGGAVNA